MDSEKNNSRRGFLKKSAIAASIFTVPNFLYGAQDNLSSPEKIKQAFLKGKKRVALIANIYRNSAHADVIATKFFAGIPTDEGMVEPEVEIVSVWIDQIGDNDTGVRIARMNGAKLYPTIADALTMGGEKLAVDAVLYIGEHGEYPKSRYGVKMYPRMNYLEQIFRVFDASDKSVPLFTDKHLPYCWRDKPLEHPIGTSISEAVAVGYASLDSYGFHVAEILQCMVERRKGGETGVASVKGIMGDEVWEAMDEGIISLNLVEAACNAIKGRKKGPMRELTKDPHAVIIKYNDGTKGAIVMLTGYVNQNWAYAAHADGSIVATEFVLDHSMSYSHFSYLSLNIQKFFVSEKPQAPVERTLLTSGIMDMGIRSLAEGKAKETPFLDIRYTAEGYEPIRPISARPTGQSLGPWPPKGYEFIIPDSFKK
jgi:hypothetical protein